MKTKLCNCNICVEGLGQSHAGSLVKSGEGRTEEETPGTHD